MQPPEYTLDHAAEILGLRTEELLAVAEVEHITLVYIIHRDTHAPYVPLDNAPEVAIRGFASEYFDEDGKKRYEHIEDARLRIVVDADLIHRIRAGERVCRNMGFIYGKPNWNMVWFSRPVEITLDNLRVPAEEIERITQRPRAAAGTAKQSDQPKPQTAKMSVPIKSRTRIQRNRAAVESARTELMKEKNREPTPDEVFLYLENDPSCTFFDVKNDALLWEDSQGKTHSMTRKTLENMLSTIRNAG